jgi:hypothetical protein
MHLPMEASGAGPGRARSDWRDWPAISWLRLLLAGLLAISLFLPWWDSQGTGLESSRCFPYCDSGLWLWLAFSGYLLYLPAIVLALLPAVAYFAAARPDDWTLLAYRVDLLACLGFVALFGLLGSGPGYPALWLALAAAGAAVAVEGVTLWRARGGRGRFGVGREDSRPPGP